ncbi:MAG TPA: cardiolipin synthase [Candidatus Binataceae bacterium]|nr:cardiolipin synthase [Candidatus Binataceae bacterium]
MGILIASRSDNIERANRRSRFGIVLALVALALTASGCGTIPNARELIHTRFLYFEKPRFVGPYGPVPQERSEEIIARIKSHQETPTDILERQMAFEQAVSNVPLVLGNKVTLLENGSATYDAMLAAIRGATSSINLEMYIISDGPIGEKFADALIERRQHGVRVHVIYDSLGSIATPASFFDRMRANGIGVVQFNPINPLSARLHWSPSHRDHRKMLIVDGRIAFTGGINISEVYASGIRSGERKQSAPYWRDTDVEIEGPAVAEFQRLFIDDWRREGGLPLDRSIYFPPPQQGGKHIVRVVGSVPEQFSLIYVDLISAVVNSETDVYITDAYFAPDRQMLRVLKHAARRGVDVRLLLPSQSDEPFIVSASRSHYAGLLKSGVKIYEWRGEMLHAKTATIDGVWSTVGTSNLDWWSIARNNEINAIILSHEFGGEMDTMFKNDIEVSQPIELAQWRRRPWRERLHEFFARMIEPLL